MNNERLIKVMRGESIDVVDDKTSAASSMDTVRDELRDGLSKLVRETTEDVLLDIFQSSDKGIPQVLSGNREFDNYVSIINEQLYSKVNQLKYRFRQDVAILQQEYSDRAEGLLEELKTQVQLAKDSAHKSINDKTLYISKGMNERDGFKLKKAFYRPLSSLSSSSLNDQHDNNVDYTYRDSQSNIILSPKNIITLDKQQYVPQYVPQQSRKSKEEIMKERMMMYRINTGFDNNNNNNNNHNNNNQNNQNNQNNNQNNQNNNNQNNYNQNNNQNNQNNNNSIGLQTDDHNNQYNQNNYTTPTHNNQNQNNNQNNNMQSPLAKKLTASKTAPVEVINKWLASGVKQRTNDIANNNVINNNHKNKKNHNKMSYLSSDEDDDDDNDKNKVFTTSFMQGIFDDKTKNEIKPINESINNLKTSIKQQERVFSSSSSSPRKQRKEYKEYMRRKKDKNMLGDVLASSSDDENEIIKKSFNTTFSRTMPKYERKPPMKHNNKWYRKPTNDYNNNTMNNRKPMRRIGDLSHILFNSSEDEKDNNHNHNHTYSGPTYTNQFQERLLNLHDSRSHFATKC